MLDFKNMLTLRQTRNSLLEKTDKCLLEDYEVKGLPITIEQKEKIKEYRKSLKDLTSNCSEYETVNDVIFPEAPTWFKG